MLRLYDYLISGNGYKVRLLLAQLGLPFERIELDIVKGETRTPEFLAKNPNGRSRSSSSTTDVPGRVERHPVLSRRGHAVPAGGPRRARAGAAVDVLRAVQPRAEHRDGALLVTTPS